jgi:hypothetical protein
MTGKCGTMTTMKGGRGRTRTRTVRRQRGRTQRGGTGNSPSGSGSAWQYVEGQVGNGNQQWDNVFVKGSGNGNQLVSVDGSNPSSPLSTYLKSGGQMGGRGRTRGRTRSQTRGQTRSRRGGFFGSVLGDALVPFGLFAAQNNFAKRVGKHHKSGKYNKFHKRH